MTRTTRLEIRDEVNIKFHDLDVATRRKLSDTCKYFLPYAFHMPAYKLGRWDGCVRFCDIGGRSYLNLLDKLIPVVAELGYDVVVDDKRQHWDLAFDKIEQDDYEEHSWPKGHPAEGLPIILRDYQVEIINKFLETPQCLQEIATGAGKTLITAALSHQCEKYGRTIVIVPNKDLVTQTEADYKHLGLDVGVFYGDRKEYNKTHTICTWQSLEILHKKSKAKEAIDFDIHAFIDGVVCIMVDEVHKAKADVLKQLLSSVFSNVPVRWGLTGTIPKDEHEKVACTSTIGPIIGQLSARELQERGVLANLEVNILQLVDTHVGFSNYAQELKWITTNPERIQFMSDMVNGVKDSGNTLILVDRIATGKLLIEQNPDWVFISGQMKASERKENYDEVKEAEGKVIVATYGVAAVGINIPRIFNLVLVEPGKSFVRVIQSIGRGIRKAKDKDFVNVYDITSTLKYSKKHLTERKKFYKEAQYPYKITKVEYL